MTMKATLRATGFVVIPTALKTDTRPPAGADRANAVGVGHQEVPSAFAGLDNSFVCVPDEIAEFVGAQ